MEWLNNFKVNHTLRKERNTFENKYHTVQDKYTALLESKVNQTEELVKYRDLCFVQKKIIKEQKAAIANLEYLVQKYESKGGKANGKNKRSVEA